RRLARGPVARLVASGARAGNDWTAEKQALLDEYDRAGLTSVARQARPDSGAAASSKNLAIALAAFELAWVDAGAATTALAQALSLAPLELFGTDEQRQQFLPGAEGPARRGAFVLTEPLPYVGVDTGVLSGKLRVGEWRDGEEPILEVEKRGRFITNMAFADFVTAAVEGADGRVKGTCLVLLQQDDPGVFDRGTPTRKLVHQLASTTDPSFRLRIPASRIVGGYSVEEGVIVPRYSHREVIEAVFRRTRVTVGLLTAAKLLSAVEPLLRYHRTRFRGGETTTPGTPRYELGLQQREDALLRLVDVWAAGEASASLGFAAARLFDELDADGNGAGARAGDATDAARAEALAAVLSPACKLWNTSHGARMMREAVSLMGGYGITEDCPGFLGHKWMDAQLEATYEGPEAVQRQLLSVTMTDQLFLSQFHQWAVEMRQLADGRPGTGACTVASAMELWLWTLRHLLTATDADGKRLYQVSRHGVTFPLADALCWLLAVRYQILDVLELEARKHEAGGAESDGVVSLLLDLCHVQAAAAAGEVGRICAELVHGYQRHPAWNASGCAACYSAADLEALEQLMPGFESTAGGYADVIGHDGSHQAKAGPCVRFPGLDDFTRLRGKLDGCLTGTRLAKDRAASALSKVPVAEGPDYPL
ncbi:MAG TPA: acyl-CoA dehydrogenase family protein, partial [Vicinamibacterales bacterium]|nr:acyl-CoA dehydrogenase family protein [Vicinamibacterales bacterium]